MKANTNLSNLKNVNGLNKKSQVTTYASHEVNSMGGVIDLTMASGKFVNVESI